MKQKININVVGGGGLPQVTFFSRMPQKTNKTVEEIQGANCSNPYLISSAALGT